MEYHLDLGKESSDGKISGIPDGHSSQNTNLGCRLKFDKQERRFDDFHPEVIKNVESPLSKYKGFDQKQRVGRKVHRRDELVKYMSKLPNFLEKGENLPEKAFNVGVLDWRLLEKWQHSKKEIVRGNERHAPFNSNTSSISSRNEGKFQDCKADPIHPSKVQQTTVSTHRSLSHDIENRLKEQRSKEPDLQRNSESDTIPSSSKGKMKVQHEDMRGREEVEFTSHNVTDHHCTEQNKTTALFPKDGPEISDPPYLSKGDDQKSMDVNRHSLAGESSASVCCADVPREAKKIDSQLDDSCSKEAKTKLWSERNISFSPSKGKNLEEKDSVPTSKSVMKNKELNTKMGISASSKDRNPSPTRRFSFDMGKMGRSLISKDTSAMQHSGAKDLTVKAGSEVTSASTGEKSNDTSRARSSPLRRLLDPFLKPKAGNTDHLANSSERDSSKTDRAVKSSGGRGESPASHFVNVKLDLKGCKTIDIDNPNNEKTGSSTVQALLHVAVKNGLPLFTFAVDNNRDILAATMKTISSRKNVNKWMYTFFSVREMKKKNGQWINKGGKDRNHGYIPNVVAQMRASDVFSSDSFRKRSAVKSSSREFVLSSVDNGDVDHQTSDVLPIDELAAIILKLPSDYEKNQCLVQSEDFLSTTVVLPGGDHGLPGKGEPSPLIKRWKSGGSCDCGGWDMGCKLRVLANHNRSNEKCSSTERRFELFSQDETTENKPVFSFSPFKDGIYSVEFCSSLKLLQAFSIGIAVFSSMKPVVYSEPENIGCKTLEETILSENNAAKISKQQVSAKYASFPPLSPVGRV